jgi:hypothetical protein
MKNILHFKGNVRIKERAVGVKEFMELDVLVKLFSIWDVCYCLEVSFEE